MICRHGRGLIWAWLILYAASRTGAETSKWMRPESEVVSTSSCAAAGEDRALGLLARKAARALEQGHISEVFEAAEAIIEAAPEVPHGYYFRGAALVTIGFFEEAKEDFDRVLAIVPDDTNSLEWLGFIQRWETSPAFSVTGAATCSLERTKGIGVTHEK